jgi:GH35 family endo-1,4-beta-xylanase
MLNIKNLLGLNYYVSELDQFLEAYEKAHPKLSSSQRQEKEKYARIYELRDKASENPSKKSLWDQF